MTHECPKCGSNANMGGWSWVLILFATGGCMLWIPVVGWVAAPFLFLGAIVMAIGVAVGKKLVLTCSNCKHTWITDKQRAADARE